MRKIIKGRKVFPFAVIFLLMFHFSSFVSAQTRSNSQRLLSIIYIDHEPSLPTSDIIGYIRKQRQVFTRDNGNSIILYMPNNQEPFIVLVNLEDPNGKYDNTENAFNRLCEALNLPFHSSVAGIDREAMINLFSDLNIINDEGELSFAAVDMKFFLTSESWKLGYNESIIAPIFFALDGKNLRKKEFSFNVYVNPEDRPTYEENAPFGVKNWGEINTEISLSDYDEVIY